MSRKLHVAMSPLTNTIFAGSVLKDGMTWASNRSDVTGEACAAVAQRALALGGEMTVTGNGKPLYRITVVDLSASPDAQEVR